MIMATAATTGTARIRTKVMTLRTVKETDIVDVLNDYTREYNTIKRNLDEGLIGIPDFADDVADLQEKHVNSIDKLFNGRVIHGK